MTVAIDVGNSRAKASLLNENHEIVEHVEVGVETLWTPDAWETFFDKLSKINFLYSHTEQKISCVNWKAFLALRIFLGYDTIQNFDINLPFDPKLIIVPEESPIVVGNKIPMNTPHVEGLIGTDRILAAYAAYQFYKQALMVVGLGTATTIDFVSEQGDFFSGLITPGLDSSYEGLLAKASHLPSIDSLKPNLSLFGKSSLESLGSGVFFSQAALIDSFYGKLANSYENILPVLTGGRAESVSPFLSINHKVHFGLVACGLSMIEKR